MLTHRADGLTGLGNDDHALSAGGSIRDAEHGNAAPLDAGDLAQRFLHFMRIDVLARANDDVLGAPCDEEVSVGDIGAIARVEPAVVEQRLRFCFVAEIAGGG